MFVVMMGFIKKYYVPICLVLVNIFIKSLYLVSESISHDEPFTIYHSQFEVSQLINWLKNYNNPPLFEFILHFWIKWFGISESSVRILPMFFSSASVFFIYQIGKDFFDKRVAFISSTLFTFSTMQIWYAHDCRVYSLFLLLTVISFYLFFRLLKEERLSIPNLVSMMIVNTLIMYAHYFGAFVWLLEGAIVVLYYLRNKQITKIFFKIVLVSGIAYLPQIVVLFQRFSVSTKNGTWLKAPIGLESIYNMIWSFCNAPVVTVLCIVVLVVALIRFIGFTDKKIQNPFIKYVIIWFVFPFVIMFCVSYKIPMFLDRYLIFITPAFYLLVALSISFLYKKKIIYYGVAFVLMVSFGFSTSFNPSKKREIKETIDYIKSKKDDKTIVLVCSAEFNTSFAYYYNRNYFEQIDQDKEYTRLDSLMKNENIYFINRLDSNLIHKINESDKIIYLDAGADFSSPNNFIKQDLTKQYTLVEEKFFYELFYIYTYTKN